MSSRVTSRGTVRMGYIDLIRSFMRVGSECLSHHPTWHRPDGVH